MNSYKLEDLKKMSIDDLSNLAHIIRKKIIDLSKIKNIHLSSNLGIVELSICLLYCFDSPKDKIVYDTGHQSYVHKILTDRWDLFETIRDFNGISGFQDNLESNHDLISSGHSGSILSFCQGIIESSEKNNFIIPIIGDATISNGIVFESLNNISFNKEKIIIILNDNGMSISENVGYLSKIFKKTNLNQKFIKNRSKIFFKNLGYFYIGPIDGHDFKKIIASLNKAKKLINECPIIIHIKTKKGMGEFNALSDKDGYFHSDNKLKLIDDSYGYYCSKWIENIIDLGNNKIKVLNCGMTLSTNFLNFSNKYKNYYEDLGIAEEHTIAKAAGLSFNKYYVFIVIYSTFLQRTYDQILHDVSRLKLPICFLIDRADISYSDGDTHHGIYDISFLKSIPNTIITSPSNKHELDNLLHHSMINKKGPFFIRYSKNTCPILNTTNFKIGEWIYVQEKNSKKLIISYGHEINNIKKLIINKNIDLINAIYITNYELKQILFYLKKYKDIFVIEKIYYQNNLYTDLVKIAFENNIKVNLKSVSIKIDNIGFGDKKNIDKKINFNLEEIIEKILKEN